ncbi:dihydropteroate synthase [Trichlorobacter ammonificans]|uniref:dihydropteroate synthase n=1 Tax=Trichlorobacter ammonificans TaxID=2916410 RepID=A0ABM9DAB8_9BACT|nr:dihydropteroate synthase [Trichlorobacter ammonificans]CAH2031565.1 Alternative dihydrofolate reductase 2 / Dihydropteroate synthase [Trichlorobacter ammonificans]
MTEQDRERSIRLLELRTPDEARRELERIGVDPAGIARMLPKLAFMPVLLPGVRAAAANIIKQEMLSLGGDAAVARGTVACSIAVTDVLLIGSRRQLTALCTKLKAQPFGLAALADRLTQLLDTTRARERFWQTSRRRIPLERPLIMGILNVTPDSFSDGGRFNDPDRAVEQALQLEAEGADLIDIGAESTRPGAPPVPAAEEIRRLVPVLERLAGQVTVPISVDTWKASVAAAACSAGAEIINDISGLTFDPAMAATAAACNAGVVLMHTRGTPQTMQQDTHYEDLMGELAEALAAAVRRACSAGIAPERIVLDPGIGFAKSRQGNLEILRRLGELTALGYPLLVGSSRKSFIGAVLGKPDPRDRLFGTAATVALAVAAGAQILRVHDVAAMGDVARMSRAICAP